MKTPDRHQQAPTPIRMADDLKEWLKVEAAANQRSLNGEVIARLEASRKTDRRRAQKVKPQ